MTTNGSRLKTTAKDGVSQAPEPLLTDQEIAQRWRCSWHKVRDLRLRGAFPSIRIGRKPLTRLSAVVEFERRNERGGLSLV